MKRVGGWGRRRIQMQVDDKERRQEEDEVVTGG